MDLLQESEKRTGCAYKGYASYWSVGDEEDVLDALLAGCGADVVV